MGAIKGAQGPMHCPVRESKSIRKGQAGSSPRKLEMQTDMYCIAHRTSSTHLIPRATGKNPEACRSLVHHADSLHSLPESCLSLKHNPAQPTSPSRVHSVNLPMVHMMAT